MPFSSFKGINNNYIKKLIKGLLFNKPSFKFYI